MNRENIRTVADAIEAASKRRAKPTIGFNMADWRSNMPDRTGHKCGTSCCIAGWAFLVSEGREPTKDDARFGKVADVGAEFLGIGRRDVDNWELRDQLFYARGIVDRDSISPKQAVSVLRHLADTGKVDWTIGAKS
jgi:hypothetical protein